MAVTRTTTPRTTPAAELKAVKAIDYQRYFVPTEMPPICQMWLFRMMLKRTDLLRYLQDDGLLYDGSLAKYGLSEKIQLLNKSASVSAILKHKCQELVRAPSTHIPYDLAEKIAELGRVIGLNDFEQQVLALAVLLSTDDGLQNYARGIVLKKSSCLEKTLQVMLDCPQELVRAALHPKGALVSCGLVTLQFPSDLEDVFDFISPNFAAKLLHMGAEPLSLLKHLWQVSPASTLSFADYPHIEPDLAVLRPYLKHALTQQKVGVNVLLYGAPGHGKTELARLLANDLQTHLFEVSSEDDDGDPIGGQQRLRAYRFAQRCLASATKQMMMFDEAEDVFYQNPFNRHYTEHKCWLNRLLEHNPMPCIWLTNDIREMDNAVIRRFDLVIEVPNLPKSRRAGLLQGLADGLLDTADALQLSAHPALSPAVIKRATDVVNTFVSPSKTVEGLGGENLATTALNQQDPVVYSRPQCKQALQRVMNNTLKAQGYSLVMPEATAPSQLYNPAFINADVEITALVAGLRHAGNARLCLYGPPGTGKTAFCQYLAEQLDKPLLFKPASALFSCYVGESEKLIAQAFAEASDDGAILLLDEVDSFLQERSKAKHSWQVTQVNELLQQMERFNGILLTTTNQLPQLDQAALRRFDLVIGFSYLSAEQTLNLFREYCKLLGLSTPLGALKQLQHLVSLTPLLTAGDFHAVARQARFRPLADAEAFVTELQKAVQLKAGASVIATEGSNRLQ